MFVIDAVHLLPHRVEAQASILIPLSVATLLLPVAACNSWKPAAPPPAAGFSAFGDKPRSELLLEC